jgi:hypothetical protein
VGEVCRYAEQNRRNRGDGKPETFNFLGFPHSCGKTRKGHFTVLRQTMRRRWQAKLQALKEELWRRLHTPIREQGAYLRSVLLGHYRITECLGMGRRWVRFGRPSVPCGVWSCAVAARATTCRGAACEVPSSAGFPCPTFVLLTLSCVSAFSPEVGAGCGNSARPDLWRGS